MPSDTPGDLASEISRVKAELAATQAVFAVFAIYQNGFDSDFDWKALGIALRPDQVEHFNSAVRRTLDLIRKIESRLTAQESKHA